MRLVVACWRDRRGQPPSQGRFGSQQTSAASLLPDAPQHLVHAQPLHGCYGLALARPQPWASSRNGVVVARSVNRRTLDRQRFVDRGEPRGGRERVYAVAIGRGGQ